MMTWPTEKLREIANKTAEKLNEHRAELEALLAKVKADLEIADRALSRAATFVPIIDGKPQCPDCHVKSGRESELVRLEDSPQTENYWCFHCKKTFALAY
jgi:DNA-directed RNA polymerase subunit M/transcription elongation factor TFIIS